MKTSFKDQYDHWYTILLLFHLNLSSHKRLKLFSEKEQLTDYLFSDLTWFSGLLGFRLLFGLGRGSNLNYSVRVQLWRLHDFCSPGTTANIHPIPK